MSNSASMHWPVAAALLALGVLSLAAPGRAQLPNLTYWYVSNWDYPLVPRDALHVPPDVRLSAVLPGDTNTIYINLIGHNDGAGATPTGFHGELYRDGHHVGDYSSGVVPPGGGFYAVDVGPTTVRGGRHTWEVRHDSDDSILESDETDNNWAHQFIFSPRHLWPTQVLQRPAPPDMTGGWASIVDGSLIDENCDGVRFTSSGWWNVVTVHAMAHTDDYDACLYDISTGSEDGFTGELAASLNVAGFLDALVVNSNVMGSADWDVGIKNYSGGSSSYLIEQIVSEPLTSSAEILVHLAQYEYFKIWDTWIPPDQAGWLTVAVDITEGSGPLAVGIFDRNFTIGALADLSAREWSDDQGRVRLHYEFPDGGYYGLFVLRQPLWGGAPLAFTLRFEATRPDIVPATPPGWSAPLVPRPLADGTPTSVTPPDTLHGYVPETWFNVAFANASPIAAAPVSVKWYRDGLDFAFWGFSELALGPYEQFSYNYPHDLSVNIPGGRHTLSLEVEYPDVIDEIFEDNNIYGEQFCWSPLEVPTWDIVAAGYPPYTFGGVGTVTTGEPFFVNCDGYRLPVDSGWWQGIVLNQPLEDDYDLFLFLPLSGVKNGFRDWLAGSYRFGGQTDYVAVNRNVAGAAVVDAGVLNLAYSGGFYTVESVTSQSVWLQDGGMIGPSLMEPQRSLHLWDVYLDGDLYAIRLDNLEGGVDWGLNLHPAENLYVGRDDVVPDGSAWLNGPGQAEWITVVTPGPGWYGLAVYKAARESLEEGGIYRLRILRGLSEVPDSPELPNVTALTGSYPNPFNPRTTIGFDLAAAGPVEVTIYDLQGGVVRRLLREDLPAGHHEAVWDGCDDGGRRCASGVYLTQLAVRGHVARQKLVMLK